jgi:hypothetical protein
MSLILLSMNKTSQKSLKYEIKRGWCGKEKGLCTWVSDILIKMAHRHPAIFLHNIPLSAKL